MKQSNETGEIFDKGIDKGLARLTPEKIEQVINKVLSAETGARLKTYVNTCVHCGLCSEACHYYLSHDNDPKFSPAGKVKQTIWEILKKKGKVDHKFLKKAAE
ncbi:MAG: 4Fe-4S dicluster domain-containing protein, partial [Deltaproteobacteria bacterium]|nr:4Fe-4S dicluster domain-containing protein [Deltaproteobacteria bacterium]